MITETNNVLNNTEYEYELWLTAWRKSLATQAQEPTT